MQQLSLKYMKTGAAISLTLMLGIAAHFIADCFQFYGSIAISFIAITTLLLGLLNSYLWSYPLVKTLYEFPDMRGTYEGTLEYRYRNELNEEQTGTLNTIRIISQNGSGLFIRSIFKKADGEISSESTARNVEVIKEDAETVKLIFHYHNEGSTQQGFGPHDGTEILRFNNSKGVKSISGIYYTNRTPFQTKGTLKLKPKK